MRGLKIPIHKFVPHHEVAHDEGEGPKSSAPGVIPAQDELQHEEPSDRVKNWDDNNEKEILHSPPASRAFKDFHGELVSACEAEEEAVTATGCAAGSKAATGAEGGTGIVWPSRTRPALQSRQTLGRFLKMMPPLRHV